MEGITEKVWSCVTKCENCGELFKENDEVLQVFTGKVVPLPKEMWSCDENWEPIPEFTIADGTIYEIHVRCGK